MLRVRGGGKQDWATPWWFYRGLDAIWQFKLDAAASPENAKCARFYTEQDNGLLLPWETWTFCNPPWAKPLHWIEKAILELSRDHRSVLVLPSNGLTTNWYRVAREYCLTHLLSPRVPYDGPGSQPNGGTMLLEFTDVQHGELDYWDISDWKKQYADLRSA